MAHDSLSSMITSLSAAATLSLGLPSPELDAAVD
jgi:hypothetical protein